MNLLQTLSLSLLAALTLSDPYLTEDCERLRRPIDQLSDDELMLYVNGMQAIRASGKYQVLIDAHKDHTEIHRGSSFFFYHSYYVWEVETQIRMLGGKFKCFSLPYYDWTIDAGNEAEPFILNSVFGGDGDPDHHNCVMTPAGRASQNWGVEKWAIQELCNPQENAEVGCCLKRNLWAEGDPLGDAFEVANVLQRDQWNQMGGGIAFHHQKVHWLFGAGDDCVSCAMATGYSPDDPIFMLLHSFTAMLRATWAACHGYDHLTGDDLDGNLAAYEPKCAEGYPDCGVIELDDVYEFGEMPTYKWSLTSQMDITPRMMWDFADWNVRYDAGTFQRRGGMYDEDTTCSPTGLQFSRWFLQDEEAENGEKRQHAQFSRVHSVSGKEVQEQALFESRAVSAVPRVNEESAWWLQLVDRHALRVTAVVLVALYWSFRLVQYLASKGKCACRESLLGGGAAHSMAYGTV